MSVKALVLVFWVSWRAGKLLFCGKPTTVTSSRMDAVIGMAVGASMEIGLLLFLIFGKPQPWFLEGGIFLSTVAALLLWWTFAVLGEHYHPFLVKPRTIVSRGPYRFMSHPMYLAAILLGVGQVLITGSLMILVPWLLFYPAFILWRLPKENRLLKEVF